MASGKVRTIFKSATQQFWPLFGPDGKTVFMTTIDGKGSNTPNLFRVSVDGEAPKAITHYTNDAVRWPAIARNGALLAYLYDGDLYTVKPDGSEGSKLKIFARSDDKVNNQEMVKLTQEATEVELSPDGKQLALVLRGDIWLVPIAGGDAKRLTDNPANDSDITWSPDNAKIVFVSDRNNQTDVYTIDVKTKALTRITNDGAVESNPQFSPDGKSISFAKAGDAPGLYVAASSGSQTPIKLSAGNGNNNFGTGVTSHSWSPDSKWVAFSRMDRYESRDIFVVPAVGGAAINVTRYPENNDDPKWTPDGKRLLVLSDRNGLPQLFQLPPRTGKRRAAGRRGQEETRP